MKIYYDRKIEAEYTSKKPRAHPWDPSGWSRYYDFKAQPGLIPDVLEDYKPFAQFPAIQRFYELLEWANGPESVLETNDCAFRGPDTNTDNFSEKRLQCSGRLMVFFRSLLLNTVPQDVELLVQMLMHYVGQHENDLEWGCVGISAAPVLYLVLPEDRQRGSEIVLTFWAWGDNEQETMENLGRVVSALFESFKLITEDVKATAR